MASECRNANIKRSDLTSVGWVGSTFAGTPSLQQDARKYGMILDCVLLLILKTIRTGDCQHCADFFLGVEGA